MKFPNSPPQHHPISDNCTLENHIVLQIYTSRAQPNLEWLRQISWLNVIWKWSSSCSGDIGCSI